MIERHPNERLAILEREVKYLHDEMGEMSRKVDEMHKVLLQAQGFRVPFVILGTVLVSSVGALASWLLGKFG